MKSRGGSKKRKATPPVEDHLPTESVLSCRIESSKILSDVLNCLVDSSRKDQLCYFEATQDSKFTENTINYT